MTISLHLGFTGNCDAAFTFYEKVFGTKRTMSMKWGEAPPGTPHPEGTKDLIMHASLPIGNIVLMGADAPPGRGKPLSGFDISLELTDETEAKRLFEALSQGGSVMMPLGPTFWSPLFGMCTDQFGVGWMVNMTGSQS